MTSTDVDEPVAVGDAARMVRFEFTGTAAEYFRIWIVNLVLTVLTLGIYSAWAKVRSNRYLYGNTLLDSRPFEYTAQPLPILKGRIIAVGLFLAWYGVSVFLPLLSLVVMLLIFAVAPWVIVRSLKFRSFHTRYRNLRFHFHGTYKEAAVTYLLWPFLAFLSFGLLWPFFAHKRADFSWDNLAYGDRRFSFFGKVGVVYGIYAVLVGILIVVAALVGVLAFVLLGWFAGMGGESADDPGRQVAIFTGLFYLVLAPLYLFPPAYLKAQMGNYVLNNVNAAGQLPDSAMQFGEVFWIYLTNAVAIVFSLGLAIPWAIIRMAKYRADHTTVSLNDDLDEIGAGEREGTAAVGEEIGDIFDLDIGF